MDRDAYRQAVEKWKDRVYGYAAYMLRDDEDAQDVAQEALVRLWEHREKVADVEVARSWLMRTAHNLCIDRLRLRPRRSNEPLEDLLPVLSDSGPAPDRMAGSSELRAVILAALDESSDRDRSVLVLREIQGHRYDEIARILELPLGTVKATLHRARERIRARLERAGVGP